MLEKDTREGTLGADRRHIPAKVNTKREAKLLRFKTAASPDPCCILSAGFSLVRTSRGTARGGRGTQHTQATMDAFSSKDLAMKAQKKILSTMATKGSIQMFIDETTSDILDELYRVSKGYSGNRSEAQKVIKDLVKIAVKIGVLFRNNRFSTEELGVAQDFKRKLHQGAMTAISFYEVEFTFDKAVMSELLTSCRDLLLQLVNTHLTPKSQGRISHVFNHYSDPDLLTKLYDPDGPFHAHLAKICNGLNKLVEDGTI
ncbi:hypothetical protein LDENG_00234190 [Lucifuga dentata]|nr:hypothetical protein LDENG_00234190 [Lucifuga dentata]